MTSETEQAKLRRIYGLETETVGDLLTQSETGSANTTAPDPAGLDGGTQPPECPEPGTPFQMPVIDGYPVEWPGEGIFFGMSDDEYHAIPALSNSGIKAIASSPMRFWATSRWLNPSYDEWRREQEEKRKKDGAEHFDEGHAYECRIFEGRQAFAERFAVRLDKKDYPNALVTIADMEAAAPDGVKLNGKSKGEKWTHLKSLDGTLELWDEIVEDHAAANEGKCLISAFTYRQMEIAAAMIEKDPEIGPIVRTGQPQVVLCWICPTTGVPMKAKLDLMKVKMIADLKTIKASDMSIERAIAMEIAKRKYAIQPSVYGEGAREVRRIVRERGASAVYHWDDEFEPGRDSERVPWALKWAQHQKRDEFLFIFQQKGLAPIARGLFWPFGGTHAMLVNDMILAMKRKVRKFAETFATDPWVDVRPIYDLADEDLPPWATEI